MALLYFTMVSCEGRPLRAVQKALVPDLSSSARKTPSALTQPHASST